MIRERKNHLKDYDEIMRVFNAGNAGPQRDQIDPKFIQGSSVGFFPYADHSNGYQFLPEIFDLESDWHPGKQEQIYMDCVIHAINLLVGGPYFQARDQFLQMYCSILKLGFNKQAMQKARSGLRLEGLKNIIFTENASYSFVEMRSWNHDTIIKKNRVSTYITDQLNKDGIRQCIVMAKFFNDNGQWDHAFVLKKGAQGWMMLDSGEDVPKYAQRRKGCQWWDRQKFFDEVCSLRVYVLQEDVHE